METYCEQKYKKKIFQISMNNLLFIHEPLKSTNKSK